MAWKTNRASPWPTTNSGQHCFTESEKTAGREPPSEVKASIEEHQPRTSLERIGEMFSGNPRSPNAEGRVTELEECLGLLGHADGIFIVAANVRPLLAAG